MNDSKKKETVSMYLVIPNQDPLEPIPQNRLAEVIFALLTGKK